MSIYSDIREIVDLMERGRNADFETLYEKVSSKILKADQGDLKELYKIFEMDYEKLLVIPFRLVLDIYKKINQLNPEDKDILYSFYTYLLLHGPNWDNEAEQLLSGLEIDDLKRCREIVQNIKA